MPEPGTLYVVATPIGNLGDITFRAIETLKSVALVLAEDTRTAKKLLNHYDITTPVTSYHQHSRGRKEEEILRELGEGRDLALISEAGTPVIADPGNKLVELARRQGHQVIPIPGAAAVTAALSAVGLGGDQFTFLGFLPHKKGRQKRLDQVAGMAAPVVLYESPHRVRKLLAELAERYPDAQVSVAREITKKFEDIRVGTPGELAAHFEETAPRGEFVVVVRV
ncbi:MAG TPA: 16S rRNA (cytidine(1402)-2'-O)-methyltransferase [Patescibacteria group bacterium]|jgi:16S rRNA (cytidine1402-2'-O)-methyltransferase